MLAFRSEAHVDRWREARSLPRGAAFTPEQLWRLAQAWYADRLAPGWRRRPADEAEALFAEIGLTGDFWRLREPGGRPTGGEERRAAGDPPAPWPRRSGR